MRPQYHILTLVLLLLGGCFDNHHTPYTEPFSVKANTSIGELRQLCRDKSYNIVVDIVCVGRVTSSDSEGNFYRSMLVEDSTGAIEVKLGSYNIESQYPIGVQVALRLNGTAVMLENGVLQLGLPPLSYDTAPREFEAQEIIDRHIIRSSSVEKPTPLLLTIPQLSISLCGRFIQINNLRYSQLNSDVEEKENSYIRFTDNNGDALFVYISPYADFSSPQVPYSEVSIQGILYYNSVGYGVGNQFILKPRFADDISVIDAT